MKSQPSPRNLLGEIAKTASRLPADAPRKRWLAAYGEQIPSEINPEAYGSVLEMLKAPCGASRISPHSTALAKR